LLNRRRVFEYAAERRVPAIYETDSLTREGGLMSYGPDRREIFERSAALVDRIFKGAKPADLPVEQPTRFLFVLNLKTAKAMGLNVPNTLLALIDEVVDYRCRSCCGSLGCYWQILLQKSFSTGDQKLSGL